MNATAEFMRIVVPSEQRSALGRVLPVEYIFDVRRAEFEECPCHSVPATGWHIRPVDIKVERLESDDSIDVAIDAHVIESVIAIAELTEKAQS